jgi:RNA polymerase sigma-70 factor (ECF subfamily)
MSSVFRARLLSGRQEASRGALGIHFPASRELVAVVNEGKDAPMQESAQRPAIASSGPEPQLEQGSAELVGLVQRVALGQQAALTELYELTVAKLYALARLILRNPSDAEEVVCDTFAQIWQSASRYESSRGSVMGWMLTICRSRALDLLRQRRARERITADQEVPEPALESKAEDGPESLLLALQQGTAVRRALESLSPIRRQLVSLAFLQGLSHQEIVEQTGLPMGTVKSHIRRALTVLRKELKIWNEHVAAV